MLDFYKEKFPMNDKRIVLTQILDTEGWENSVDPVMLINLSPDQAFQLIEQKVNTFSAEQIKAKDSLEEERMKRIANMLNKKNEGNQSNKNSYRQTALYWRHLLFFPANSSSVL